MNNLKEQWKKQKPYFKQCSTSVPTQPLSRDTAVTLLPP